MKSYLLLGTLFFATLVNGQNDTTTLNPEISYTAEKATYLELLLEVKSNFSPVYLRNTYMISGDTLYDYVKFDKSGLFSMKILKLDSGEVVFARSEPFQKIDSADLALSLVWVKNDLILPEHISNKTYVEFVGNVWQAEQKVLFRYRKNGTHSEKLILHIGLTPGFDYSMLYLSTKLVYEYENALEKEMEIDVMPFRRKNFDDFVISIPVEGEFNKSGEFYFELQHSHFNRRLNGISFIAIERVKK